MQLQIFNWNRLHEKWKRIANCYIGQLYLRETDFLKDKSKEFEIKPRSFTLVSLTTKLLLHNFILLL